MAKQKKSTKKREKGVKNILTAMGITEKSNRKFSSKQKLNPNQVRAVQRMIALRKRKGLSLKNTNLKENLQYQEKLKQRYQIEKERENKQLSQNTKNILTNLLRVQSKSRTDDDANQRRVRERQIVGRSMNLMKAHENMNKVKLDMTGVSTDNILKAENIFKKDEINNPNILKKRGISLLDTGENTLKF